MNSIDITQSLNITADPPLEAAVQQRKEQSKRQQPKKRNNKYEKRRARSAQAKELKQQQHATTTEPRNVRSVIQDDEEPHTTGDPHHHTTQSRENDGDDAAMRSASVPDDKDSASVAVNVDESAENSDDDDDDASVHEKSPVAKKSPARLAEHGSRTKPNKEIKEATKKVKEGPTKEKNTLKDTKKKTRKEGDSQQQQQQQHHLQDTAVRAAYLAEFHARPLELDRRAGAMRQQHEQSRASLHLFTEYNSWDALQQAHHLHARLIAAVTSSSGFDLSRPTVIQSKAIPAFATTTTTTTTGTGPSRNNLFLHSETGSGKTLAYLLPILQSLAVDDKGEVKQIDRATFGTRCIILCPTRELASQTVSVAEKLCAAACRHIVPGCLLGECGRKSEKARIRKGLALVVATPGRLLDHLARTESLLLSLKGKLEWLVLDEADRLLDMGLGDQVQQILQRIRANQSGSGVNGITWRSVLVSATVTEQVQTLAKETLLGGNSNAWVAIKGDTTHAKRDNNTTAASSELADSTPRQLIQLHMTVSAKLRLTALLSFLVERASKNEKTVVFVSTCAATDYYHALFQAMDCILPSKQDDPVKGIFGSRCPIFKLHGSVPHGERQLVLRKFMKDEDADGKKRGSVLLATDVAARGLNLPSVDWIVQYDPPSDVSDYVHRAGRVARAGRAGHSLLFLLPSEQDFLTVLKQRGVQKMSAISLASTLNSAATICTSLADEGVARSGGGLLGKSKANSRSGEAFCSELQHRLEDCVVQNDIRAKAAAAEQSKEKQQRKVGKREEVSGELMELARKAFLSYIRAYPTKEKLIRHIFAAKALHLGHVARSFALKEPPKKLAASKKRTAEKAADISTADGFRTKKALAFDVEHNNEEGNSNPTKRAKRGQLQQQTTPATDDRDKSSFNPAKARSLLMANAVKLQNHMG